MCIAAISIAAFAATPTRTKSLPGSFGLAVFDGLGCLAQWPERPLPTGGIRAAAPPQPPPMKADGWVYTTSSGYLSPCRQPYPRVGGTVLQEPLHC